MSFKKVVVSLVCLFSLSSCSFSSNESSSQNEELSSVLEITKDSNSFQKLLTDKDGNVYKLNEFQPVGYSITDENESVVLEYSDEAFSPYFNYSENLMYYGPMNYYVKEDDHFVHTITNEIISDDRMMPSIDLASIHPKEEKYSKRKGRQNVKRQMYTHTLRLDNYKYLTDISEFANNTDGTCGYLAAALCLYYCYRQYSTNYIDSDKISYDQYGNINGIKSSLQDELLSIGYDLGYSNATIASDIKNVMDKYASNHNLSFTNFSQLLSNGLRIDDCIKNNKPSILFGRFVDAGNEKNKINHAVVLFGIYEETFTGAGTTTTNRYFEVNYGWPGYTAVRLYDSLFTNPVGSFYNLNP